MTHWFKRQTSMRGRLAILLILLMVLPMAVVGWFSFQSIAGGQPEQTDDVRLDDLHNRAAFRVNEITQTLHHDLEVSMRDMSMGLVRMHGTDAASVSRAFGDLPPELRPVAVTEMDARGRTSPSLGEVADQVLRPLVEQARPVQGYLALPEIGSATKSGPESLYQVAIEPKAGGRALIALRLLSGEVGTALLESFPHASTVSLALTLRNSPLQARVTGRQCVVGRRAPDLFDERDGVSEEFWTSAISESGRDVVQPLRRGESVVGGIALRDPSGVPVGLALVQATDGDLFPLFDTQRDLLGTAGAIKASVVIGWMVVTGVLLAIAMGLLAPRWVWRDIRTSTDFIFNSVERLRELVRRNSRALDEQSQIIKDLMDSMTALDKASCSIAETSRILAHSAEQSAWVSQSGNQNAETAQRGVLEVRDRAVALSDQMQELERRCGAIGSILGFIDHLSNETNDLSINATIQAADAGSSGRQFATVASEIGKLAEQARKSTHDIQQLIEQIQASSRTTLDATKEGNQVVDRCLESFEELESAFARILRWVEQTTQSAHGIEQSTAQQAQSLQVVSQSIESLELRARETVDNYQAVVEAADELATLGAEMNVTWRVG